PFDEVSPTKCGMNTGDNARFVRNWSEVPFPRIGFRHPSHLSFQEAQATWVPYNKGGNYRRWYGNCEHVLRYDTASHQALGQMGNSLPSEEFYFRPSLSWTKVSISFSPRFYDQGF